MRGMGEVYRGIPVAQFTKCSMYFMYSNLGLGLGLHVVLGLVLWLGLKLELWIGATHFKKMYSVVYRMLNVIYKQF